MNLPETSTKKERRTQRGTEWRGVFFGFFKNRRVDYTALCETCSSLFFQTPESGECRCMMGSQQGVEFIPFLQPAWTSPDLSGTSLWFTPPDSFISVALTCQGSDCPDPALSLNPEHVTTQHHRSRPRLITTRHWRLPSISTRHRFPPSVFLSLHQGCSRGCWLL